MPARVHIFTASTGAGHDLPAEFLARALRERGATALVVDGLAIAGPVARRAIAAATSPGGGAGRLALDAGYLLATRLAPLRGATSAALDRLARRGVERHLREHPPDVAVSTHPLWSQLLGRLRRRGTLPAPAVSAITDLAALSFWAHPGIDLHLIAHPESAAEARAVAGAETRIEAVHGLTDMRFCDPPDRSAARTELGLPTRGSLVVVSGGRSGVGDLDGATETALHYGADRVVVRAGRDERARERMQAAHADDDRVQVWGFTDRMVTLLAAADVLIHSSAGLTVLEALMCDCRVISYGCGHGHVRENNRAYERLGMVTVARNHPQLAHALIHALAAPPLGPQVPDLPAAADLVLELCEREPAHVR
ncbi:MAG TPA: glycosyltransferase [Solirubrobacteraceae bacterium]|nr:glycosyltransferase [Solirubrobacteraceae bacterium]